VGRHAAPATPRSGPSRDREIAAWGAFTVPLSVVVLVLLGVDWPVLVGVAALGSVAFALVVLAIRLLGPGDVAAGEQPPGA